MNMQVCLSLTKDGINIAGVGMVTAGAVIFRVVVLIYWILSRSSAELLLVYYSKIYKIRIATTELSSQDKKLSMLAIIG